MARVGHDVVELEDSDATLGETAEHLGDQLAAFKERVDHQQHLVTERRDLFTHAADCTGLEVQFDRQACLKCFHLLTSARGE
ncbi:hypothetical protein D3C75_968720 [compost metagenome]